MTWIHFNSILKKQKHCKRESFGKCSCLHHCSHNKWPACFPWSWSDKTSKDCWSRIFFPDAKPRM